MIDEPWQPALIYTPRGVGPCGRRPRTPTPARSRRSSRPPRGDPARAARARHDARPRDALAASPAGVSEHLGILRRAGLVRAQRDGRRVLYARTAAGEQVLRAPGGA
jgi:DNA-binding transcriptional ArsR family regulator